MTIDEFVQLAEARRIRAEDLDNEVHDAASSLASRTNNGGLESQIKFLVGEGYSETELKKIFDEILGGK